MAIAAQSGLGLSVKIPDQPLQPLDPGEALRSQAYVRRESPAQGARQQPEPIGYLTYRNPPGQGPGGSDHRRVRPERASHLPEQEVFHHSKRIPRGRRLEQPFPQARTHMAVQVLKRYQGIAQQGQGRREEAMSGPQREGHGHVRVPLFELDHRGVPGRPGDHGPWHPANLARSLNERNASRFRLTHRLVSGPGKIFSTDVRGCSPARYVIAVTSPPSGGAGRRTTTVTVCWP